MRLVWSREAEADKEMFWHFLADGNVDLADRVQRRIEERATSLTRLPRQGRAIGGDTVRRLSIPDVRCVIDYRVENFAIRILRIRSTSQDFE